ncbi:MAG: DUF3562 domain-containing protein [Pseudomonadota bacterium]
MRFIIPPSPYLPLPSHVPLALYDNVNQQVKHMHIIERLADEIARPVAEIKPLYEDILLQMRERAKIQDYLPLLVCKRVKFILTH